MGKLLAIDPGNEQSAWVLYDAEVERPVRFAKCSNDDLLDMIYDCPHWEDDQPCHLAVEMIASYGMSVGKEVFDTCVLVGRILEAWEVTGGVGNGPGALVYRQTVKLHLCHDSRAKDKNIRQALIDRFGPGKAKAIGKKKTPGPLYGVSNDVWSALAIAVTFSDSQGGAA
jgi:hypothetical protein